MGQAATRLLIYAGILTVGGVAAASVLQGGSAGRPKIKPGMKVFLLGDSLAVGLTRPLSTIASEHNVGFKALAKEGTRIDQWGSNYMGLFQAVRDFKPDLILVSLGTNDEYMKLDAKARQLPHIQKLLAELRATAPVVWIGPPKFPSSGYYTWTKSNGAIPLIREQVPSSQYFPSHELDIQRAPDLLHPSVAGAAAWAGEIWRFIT
jgi:lysophospholipase L1-like esterase